MTKTPASSQATSEQTVVLLADSFSNPGVQALEELGCNVVLDASLEGGALVEAIESCNPTIIVVRSTKITSKMVHASSKLGVIIRAGAGCDTIDVAAASSRGIFVANCPGKNSIAVAELAWSLILSCDRKVPDQVADLRKGKWRKSTYKNANGLHGRTLGIVGLGCVGAEVAKRGLAFGMNVIAWSRGLTQERASALGLGWCENLHNLAKMSDVVTVHIASTKKTEHLINEAFLDVMKDDAIFINTSRGKVVDEKALGSILERKGLRVGLDVYENEPTTGEAEFNAPIVSNDRVYGTHHVGASTIQAQDAIADEAIRVIQQYLADGIVHNCVNRATSTSAKAMLCVRHRNFPGVLARIFDLVSQEGVNVEEMENVVYQGEEAACARMQLDKALSPDSIASMREHEHVLSVTTSEINEEGSIDDDTNCN